jgi:DNA-nicking Smr family endonuclease
MSDDKRPRGRGHRGLSAEEEALWHAVARSTRPLKRRRGKPGSAKEESAAAPAAMAPAKLKPAVGRHSEAAKPVSRTALPPLAPLGRRERSRLSRGHHEIDVRIDLHGMTQTRAHRALLAFLQRAAVDGAAFALVITGKGRSKSADDAQGVLRRQVPLWLALPEFRALVIGFEEAHGVHGGRGALYVRIRRARPVRG